MLAQVPLAIRNVEIALYFLYPLPQMVLAAGLVCAGKELRRRRGRSIFQLCVALFVIAEVWSLSSSVSLLRERVEHGAHVNSVYRLADWLNSHPETKDRIVFNEGDNLQPYLYFLAPDEETQFSLVSAGEFVQGIEGNGDAGVKWTLVYGRPGPRPGPLSAPSPGQKTVVEVAAEFSEAEFEALFPPIAVAGEQDQSHFGPPVTVYRLWRPPEDDLDTGTHQDPEPIPEQ